MLVYQDLNYICGSFKVMSILGPTLSAEGADEDDQSVKVVGRVDAFRLQEQPPFDKKQFIAYMKKYIKNLTSTLQERIFVQETHSARSYQLPSSFQAQGRPSILRWREHA